MQKIRFSRRKKVVIACISAALAVSAAYSVVADPLDDIAWIQLQQEGTYAELEQVQASIADIEQKKNDLLSKIEGYDTQLVTTIATISSLDAQIKNKEVELQKTAAMLEKAQADEKVQYEAMKSRIQYIYEQGGDLGLAGVVFGESDLGGVLNRAEDTQSMYEYDRSALDEYGKTTEKIAKLQERQRRQKSALLEMKRTQTGVQENLENLKAQAQQTSADYEQQLADATEQANAYYSLIEQQNAEIARLQEIQRQAEEAAWLAAQQAAIAAQQAAAQQAAMAVQEPVYVEDYSDAGLVDAAYDTGYTEDLGYTDGLGYTEDYGYTDDLLYTDGLGYTDDYGYTDGLGYTDDYGYTDGLGYTEDYGYTDDYSYVDDYSYITDYGYEDYTYDDTSYNVSYDASDYVADTSSSEGLTRGQEIANYALQFVGNSYVWGGTSLTNGCDCSGFVQSVYGDNGVSLSRTTYTQMNEGTPVSYDEMQPGDVINYGYHTAIYIGDNQIVHAADESLGIIVSDNPAFEPIVTIRRFV